MISHQQTKKSWAAKPTTSSKVFKAIVLVNTKMADRVLALSMRPRSIEELVGQEDLIKTLSTQFESNRIPHFFIISGPIGAGKTTLARILALILQSSPTVTNPIDGSFSRNFVKFFEKEGLAWDSYKSFDIQEINAANKNGIDDIRQITEILRYQPMPPSKAKVVIMDEAHQLTIPAQNALLTETEDVAKHVFYIFCTSAVSKIIPALQRRAYIINPKPLSSEAIADLLERAKEKSEFQAELKPLYNALKTHDVNSPGLVLQAAERFFSGIPAQESVLCSVENPKIDTMELCRSLVKGDWKGCSTILKEATKADVIMIKSCVLGYMKTVVLKNTGEKAYGAAKAIKIIAAIPIDEGISLPSMVAAMCLACKEM